MYYTAYFPSWQQNLRDCNKAAYKYNVAQTMLHLTRLRGEGEALH